MNKVEDNIVVSISCLTFNHAPFIRQCLDGFIMQRTNFEFEVLIHDDASTDGTEEIIREYEAKYPGIIKPIYEKENQWVLGRRGSKTFNYPRAKGKYIALCEGDDYWRDPLKLQKQVDFLEANENCIGTFHNVEVITRNSIISDFFKIPCAVINTKELLKYGWFVPTCSILIRNNKVLNLNTPCFNIYPAGDISLLLKCSKLGYFFKLEGTMGVYRFYSENNASSRLRDRSYAIATLKKYSRFIKQVNVEYFDNKYKYTVLLRNVRIHISILKQRLMRLLNK